MSDAAARKPFVQFNIECLKASAGIYIGWVLWAVAEHGYEFFFLMSVLFYFAGFKRALIALFILGKLILGMRKLAQFKRKGATPKADSLASEDDLRKKGLTR